jgi:cytoskeleton protein RodZ
MAKGTFGERLKRERELREVTREEVAAATRISDRFLTALENEDWDRLPGGIFGRGFVRSIARYLGLDEENLLSEYDLARGDQSSPAPPRPEIRLPSPSRWIAVLYFLVLLLALAGLVYGGIYGWRKYAMHHNTGKSALTPQGNPSSRVPSAEDTSASGSASPGASSLSVSPASETPLDLSVSASAAVHLRILGDGKLLFDAEFPGGENRHFIARERFEVSASDSSDVLLELNGQAMPPLGEPGASGTIVLGRQDLKQAAGGNSQP